MLHSRVRSDENVCKAPVDRERVREPKMTRLFTMKKYPRIFLILSVIGYSAAAVMSNSNKEKAFCGSGDIMMDASLSELGSMVDGPVELELTLVNNSRRTVSLDLGADHVSDLEIIVTFPDGTIKNLPTLELGGLRSLGIIKLVPKTRQSTYILLNLWLELTLPGRYKLRILARNPVLNDEGEIIADKITSEVSFDLAAKQTNKLNRLAKDLQDKVTPDEDVTHQLRFALAMSYIETDQAFKLMAAAAHRIPTVASFMVDGLARNRSREAVMQLRKLARDTNADTSAMARDALRHPENRSRVRVD